MIRARRQAGLTLIELTIVLVILGLALGLAMPFLGRGVESVRVAAARRRVVSFLIDAGARSVNTARPVRVTYDFASGTFSQTLEGDAEPKAGFTLPEGLRVTRVESPSGKGGEGGEGSLTFYPLGDSSGAVFHLEESGGRRFSVTVGRLDPLPVVAAEAD